MSDNTYDDLPYADYCFPRTHPEHLFVVSALCGRAAPDFLRPRVLELGCARGSNLLPMALDLPDGDFVGVDLSRAQVREASARAERLGLRNVCFREMSLADIDEGFGDYDYIVCHGVYSWVPPEVRAAILRVCHDRLRPDGVAYVSFNTLPGWNNLRTIRDYLRMHVPPGPATERLSRARRALAVLTDAVVAERSSWGRCLRDELSWIADADDSYVFHEYLEAFNDACYLTEFVSAAAERGLAYLADANLTVAAVGLRDAAHDPIALAQSVDFASNRRFRAALLVRAPSPSPRVDPAGVARLHVASRAELTADVSPDDLRRDAPLAFVVDDRRVELCDPWIKCALVALSQQRPRPMSYAGLSAAVGALLGLDPRESLRRAASHARDVIDLAFDNVVELRGGSARYGAEIGSAPVASPLARAQAAETDTVTTYRHVRVELPAFERAMLPLLDGTRGRAALIEAMGALPRVRREAPSPGALAGRCEEALEWLVSNALLSP